MVGPMLVSADIPTLSDVEGAMQLLSDIVVSAARDTVGQARIAPGKTKAWMSAALRRTLTCRRAAYARWLAKKTEDNAQALATADTAARSALRKAKRDVDRRHADNLNKAWAEQPGRHGPWHALKSSRTTEKSIGNADALASPDGELHVDPQAKVSVLREHYARIATPAAPQPATPNSREAEVQAHHARVAADVAHWRANPFPDDPAIDAKPS